jgi:hypothetical protein
MELMHVLLHVPVHCGGLGAVLFRKRSEFHELSKIKKMRLQGCYYNGRATSDLAWLPIAVLILLCTRFSSKELFLGSFFGAREGRSKRFSSGVPNCSGQPQQTLKFQSEQRGTAVFVLS